MPITFIQQEFADKEDKTLDPHFKKENVIKTYICSKFFRGLLIAFLVAVIAPTIAYYFVISRSVIKEEPTEHYSCLVQEEYRVPCGRIGINQEKCEKYNCCFNKQTRKCHHYLPSKYYYKKDNNNNNTYTSFQTLTPFGTRMTPKVSLTLQNKSDYKFSLILHDPSEQIERKIANVTSPEYKVNYSAKKLVVEVLDRENNVIFTTANGALIASDKYWEWSFKLTNNTIFGLDSNVINLTGNQTLTKVFYKNENDHTTLPVFWAYTNRKFHGCIIKHDGPMELTVLASNIIILRSLTGKKIEIEITIGSTPSDLYKRQFEDIRVPPLWALGTHNCRKGSNVNLNQILKTYEDNKGSNFDVDCLHENLFLALQWNNTKEDLKNFQTALTSLVTTQNENSNTKFLLSLPPHILADDNNTLYITAKELNVLYKNGSEIYIGKFLSNKVAYPDFSHPSISNFIQKLMKWIDENIGLELISGFILNYNWPQDDSYKTVLNESFPYFSEELNSQIKYTLPWTLTTYNNKSYHLEKHNLYGSLQYSALQSWLSKNDTFKDLYVISATKNFDDTEPEISDSFETSWDNFQVYLSTILFNSITGNSMVGLPICGDATTYNKTLQETLCIRWYIAAASMPYFRVSSGDPFRDPANLNTKYAEKAANASITKRNLLKDYYYTILSRKEPLVRPMYFDYYTNTSIFNLHRQYTIGRDLIVAHPFSSGKQKLQVYLPPERGIWYELWGGTMFKPTKSTGYFMDIDVLETDWVSLFAERSIVPMMNTATLQLYVALECSTVSCIAEGELYKDQSLIYIAATNTSVTLRNLPEGCNYTLGYVRVYGYENNVGYQRLYLKNDSLCDNGTAITIDYISQ